MMAGVQQGYTTDHIADAASALGWLVTAGADALVSGTPRNWLAEPVARPAPPSIAPASAAKAAVKPSPVAGAAQTLAEAASDLDALNTAVAGFAHPARRPGVEASLWSGAPGLAVAVISDQPEPAGSDAATLRDRMLAAIGLAPADHGLGHLVPWPLTGSRAPNTSEIAAFAPFLARAIALARPRLILAFGQHAAALAGSDRGISTLRGKWMALGDTPMLATFHPRQLLNQPEMKRLAWADLQAFAARIKSS